MGAAPTGSTAITNCANTIYHVVTGGNPAANGCAMGASGYSVSAGNGGVTAYTTDTNCHTLHTGNTTCSECTFGYYWDAAKCVQSAGLIGVFFGAIAVLFM